MIASSRPDVASSPITARTCTNPESNWAKNAKPEKLIPVYEQKAEAYHIVHQSSRLLHPKAHHRLTRLIVTVISLPLETQSNRPTLQVHISYKSMS